MSNTLNPTQAFRDIVPVRVNPTSCATGQMLGYSRRETLKLCKSFRVCLNPHSPYKLRVL
jgi:hypothetical protein